MTGQPTARPDVGPWADGRAILAAGRGRVIAFAIVLGCILPIAILRHRGDAVLASWADAQRAGGGVQLWQWLALLATPGTWMVAAIVGFGIAAAFNWPNTARWMGMLLLAVLWAGLADIAVGGQTSGMATVGAVACLLTLWQPRGWPLWTGLGTAVAIARIVTGGGTGSGLLLGSVLGMLGVLVIEYGWHHATPDAPPARGAPLQS